MNTWVHEKNCLTHNLVQGTEPEAPTVEMFRPVDIIYTMPFNCALSDIIILYVDPQLVKRVAQKLYILKKA